MLFIKAPRHSIKKKMFVCMLLQMQLKECFLIDYTQTQAVTRSFAQTDVSVRTYKVYMRFCGTKRMT